MNTDNSSTLVPAYTPLETLLLFQSLHQQGISPATFATISELLKNNLFIKSSPTYNPGRLSPDALQNLFQQLLRDELRSGPNSGGSGGSGSGSTGGGNGGNGPSNNTKSHATPNRRDVSLSPNSNKRKLPSPSPPPLPTLEEAQRHTDKLLPLINRLYTRYRDHVIWEIQREEANYAREHREWGEIFRGDWDEKIRREESRTPGSNGIPTPPVRAVVAPGGQRPPSGVVRAGPVTAGTISEVGPGSGAGAGAGAGTAGGEGGGGGGFRQPTASRPAASPSPVPLPAHTTQARAQAQATPPVNAPPAPSVLNGPLRKTASPQLSKQSPVPAPRNIVSNRRTSIPPPPVPTPSPMPTTTTTGAPSRPAQPVTLSPVISRPVPSQAPVQPATPVVQHPPAPPAPPVSSGPPGPPGLVAATPVQVHPPQQQIASGPSHTPGPRPPGTLGQQQQQASHPIPPQSHAAPTQETPQPSVPAVHQQGPRPPYQAPQQKPPIPYPQHPQHHTIQPSPGPGPGSGPQPPQRHIPKAHNQKHNAPVLQHPQQASSPYAQKASLVSGPQQLSPDLTRRQDSTAKPKQGQQGAQHAHTPTQLKWEPVVTPGGASQQRQVVHPSHHGVHPPPPPHHQQQYQHQGLRNPQAATHTAAQALPSLHLQPPRPPPPPPTTIGTTAPSHSVLVAPSHPHPGSPMQPPHSLPPQVHHPHQQPQHHNQHQLPQQQTAREVVTPPVPHQQSRPQPPVQHPPTQGQPQPPYYPQYSQHSQQSQQGRPPLGPAHTQPPTTTAGHVATAASPIQSLPAVVGPPSAPPPPPPKPPVHPPQQPKSTHQPQQPQQQPQQLQKPQQQPQLRKSQQQPTQRSTQQPLQHQHQPRRPALQQRVQQPRQPVKPPIGQVAQPQPIRRGSQAGTATTSPAPKPSPSSALNSPFPRPGPPVSEHLRHASTPAGGRPRPARSLPQTPASHEPTPLLHTGTGTGWVVNPTPRTPRPEAGAMPSPSVVPLSPSLRSRQTPVLPTEPAPAESFRTPGSGRLEPSRHIGQQAAKPSPKDRRPNAAKVVQAKEEDGEMEDAAARPKKQPVLEKIDSAQASRRPSRGANRSRPTLQAVTRARRSKSVASTAAEEASPIVPDVASAKVKDEVSTPRLPDDTDDATADESQHLATPTRAPPQRHRPGKRKRQEDTPDIPAPMIVAPTTPPTHVLWTRGFPKVSASVLDQIASHRYANMFADKIKARDAPRYHDIVAYPQDLRKIRSAIHTGNKAATQALHNLDGGDPGTPSVWLRWHQSLVPPKGIINTEQLECELVHMFSNAIMYNPDPFRGPGPGFRNVWQREEDERTGALGYMNEPDVVVKDTRNMYVEVEKLLSELRSAEKDQPPLPPGASGIFTDAHLNTVARSIAEANSRAASASRERTVATEDETDELATDPDRVNREHRAKRRKA